MIETINEKVGVVAIYQPRTRSFSPHLIKWQLRTYTVRKVCYQHKVRLGRTIHYIFHVTDGTMDFKLIFDTDSLTWVLSEVCDGTTS